MPSLFAGYLLWPAEALDAVAAAWAGALDGSGGALSTSLSLIQAPLGPPFPPQLQGGGVVHLALACSTGREAAEGLLAAVRAAAGPVVDTTGLADATRLGGIHLDPPPGAAAIGDGRWLTDAAGERAADLLRAADGSSPIVMAEVRNVANPSTARSGAMAAVGGPFVGHAVAALRPGVDAAAAVAAVAGFQDRAEPMTVRPLASWAEGATAVPGSLPAEALVRLRAVADAVDPNGLIRRSRVQAR